MRTLPMLAGCLLLTASSALAAAPPRTPDVSPSALRALQACIPVAADAERLACFDKAAGALQTAERQGDVVVIDRGKAREIRRQAFGFALPSLSLFERGEAAPNRIELTLASASQDGAGRWRLTTTDGAVWRQTDDAMLNHDPKAGGVMVARKGSLGSYFCRLPGELEVRCQRVS